MCLDFLEGSKHDKPFGSCAPGPGRPRNAEAALRKQSQRSVKPGVLRPLTCEGFPKPPAPRNYTTQLLTHPHWFKGLVSAGVQGESYCQVIKEEAMRRAEDRRMAILDQQEELRAVFRGFCGFGFRALELFDFTYKRALGINISA